MAACAEERALPELDEVRVSTHRELDPIVPPTGQTTSAALQELVCPAVDREFEIRQIDATTFDLTRKPSSPRSLDDLAQKLRHRDLVSARVDSGAVRVTLKPGAYPSLLCIEDGDYRVASYARTELVLERARGAGIHRIRALAFHDSEEEWRRFLAREVDVAPAVNQGQLRYLRELPTVKLVGGQTAHATGLRFNTERVPQELRKAISLAIHRKAVARSLGYPDTTAVSAPEDAAEAARLVTTLKLPSPFRVMVPRGETDMRRAALVLEENLQRVGIPTSFEVLEVDAIVPRLKSGDFEAQIFFVELANPALWGLFRSDDPINSTRYANPEFDAAADAGDARRVREIIVRDVLEVPIFRVPDAVAVDARLCGIKPNLVDLSWLGGVHVCAAGETE